MGEYGGDIYIGHPQYGGGSAGSNYYHALSGIGNDIARGMMYYHQQHVKYDQAYQVADALSRIGISPQGNIVPIQMDEKGKPLNKDIRPILDKQALQQFQANNQRQRVANTAALDALGKIGIKQIERAMNHALNEQGSAGQLRRARIPQVQARTNQINLQVAKTLGLIPDIPKPPTGGQILKQQQDQIKNFTNQQKDISNRLANAKAPIPTGGMQTGIDPQLLLDDLNNPQFTEFGQPGGALKKSTFYPKTDDKDITHARIIGGADNGKDLFIPIKQYDRLRGMAEQWQSLGQDAEKVQQAHSAFNQSWGSLSPSEQQIALQKLNNPTQFMTKDDLATIKGLGLTPFQFARMQFNKKFGENAADLISNATQPQPEGTPMPQDTGTTEDTDTSGEQDNPDIPSGDTSGEEDTNQP